ncbi:MAG: hypothetical protein FJY99_04980 [Candidatus Sericytochromatia bacterium]|nr:hypothetical protein [Candidatus Tanganyikabacteria bacterium]
MFAFRSYSLALVLTIGVAHPALAKQDQDQDQAPAPVAAGDASGSSAGSGGSGPDPLIAGLLPLTLAPLSAAVAPALSILTVPLAASSGHLYAGDGSRGLLAASLGAASMFAGGISLWYGSSLGSSNVAAFTILNLLGFAGLLAPVVGIPLDAANTARRKRESLAAKDLLTTGEPADIGSETAPKAPTAPRFTGQSTGPWIAGLPALSTAVALNVSDPGTMQALSATGLALGYVIGGDFQRAAWVSLVGSFFQASLIGASKGTSIIGSSDAIKLTGTLGALAIAGLTAWDSVRLYSSKLDPARPGEAEAPAAALVATDSVQP